MHAKFDYSVLAEAVGRSFAIVDPKNTHLERYQLLNLSISQDGKLCAISSSNMMMQTEVAVPCDGDCFGGWSFWVSAKVFKDLVSSFQGAEAITLSLASGSAEATSAIDVVVGKSVYKVKTLSGYYAEPLQKPEGVILSETDLDEFVSAVSQVSLFSVDNITERFSGIHINPNSFLATDGRILAIRNNMGIFPVSVPTSIDQKSLHRFIKFFKTTPGKIRACALENRVYFETDTARCSIVQLTNAGKFPGYKSILDSTAQNKKATIDKALFIEKIKRSLLFTDGHPKVALEFLEDCTLSIRVQSQSLGESFETLSYKGEGFRESLLMNGKSIVDILSQLDKPEIDMYVGKTPTPIRFEEGSYVCLALPMTNR